MELKILEQTQNALLARNQILVEVSFEAQTPSRAELRAQVAKLAKAKPEQVMIKNIDTLYGNQKAAVLAFVYADKAALDTTESDVFKKRMGDDKAAETAPASEEKPAAQEPKEEAAATQAPAAEEKKEEVAEEKPAEEEKKEEAAPAEEQAAEEKPAEEAPKEEAAAEEKKEEAAEEKPAEEAPKEEDKKEESSEEKKE